MKSLLNEVGYQEIKQRFDQLNEKSIRQWGKMSVAQMCWHCQYPLKIALDNKPNSSKGNWFLRTFFKKSLFNDTPWRKGLPTAPQLKAREEKDFEIEYAKLKKMIDEFHQLKDREIWHPHPAFGSFTVAQWGQMEYKHLDHHLRQFGL